MSRLFSSRNKKRTHQIARTGMQFEYADGE